MGVHHNSSPAARIKPDLGALTAVHIVNSPTTSRLMACAGVSLATGPVSDPNEGIPAGLDLGSDVMNSRAWTRRLCAGAALALTAFPSVAHAQESGSAGPGDGAV